MGIAGQVFSKAGTPVNSLVVVAQGFVNETPIDLVGMTGLSKAYGSGGYEIVLANQAVATTKSIFVTVYDLKGRQVSPTVIVNTYKDCKKNLVLLNFKQK